MTYCSTVSSPSNNRKSSRRIGADKRLNTSIKIRRPSGAVCISLTTHPAMHTTVVIKSWRTCCYDNCGFGASLTRCACSRHTCRIFSASAVRSVRRSGESQWVACVTGIWLVKHIGTPFFKLKSHGTGAKVIEAVLVSTIAYDFNGICFTTVSASVPCPPNICKTACIDLCIWRVTSDSKTIGVKCRQRVAFSQLRIGIIALNNFCRSTNNVKQVVTIGLVPCFDPD